MEPAQVQIVMESGRRMGLFCPGGPAKSTLLRKGRWDYTGAAFRQPGDFDPTRPFAPWLRGIAVNLVRGHQRKFRAVAIGGNAELQAMLDQGADSAVPEGRESTMLEALRECLHALAEPQRQLVMRRYGDGESIGDLTRELGR